ELARVNVVDLVPADWGRDGRLRHAADGVGAGDGVVARILVVIHEQHRRVPVLAPPGGGDQVRGAPLDLAGEGERGPSHLGEAPSGLDPDVDVQASPARGLGPSGRAELAENLARDPGYPAHRGELAGRPGVQVDAP